MGKELLSHLKKGAVLPETILLLLVLSFPFSTISGQVTVYDSVADSRLQFLKSTLQTDHQRTQRWWYGWLGAYSAATIGQGAVFFMSDSKSMRQDMALGAVTTLLGATGQFISTFMPNKEFSHFSSLSENSDEDKLQKLAAAEKLLYQWSERERLALTWQNHILSATVNIGGGLVTWLAFDDENHPEKKHRTLWAGVANFALNTVITETQIWVQPTLAKRQYKKYCQRYLTGTESYSYVPEVNWYVETKPGGIGLKITF
jgi:hypothetical protein